METPYLHFFPPFFLPTLAPILFLWALAPRASVPPALFLYLTLQSLALPPTMQLSKSLWLAIWAAAKPASSSEFFTTHSGSHSFKQLMTLVCNSPPRPSLSFSSTQHTRLQHVSNVQCKMIAVTPLLGNSSSSSGTAASMHVWLQVLHSPPFCTLVCPFYSPFPHRLQLHDLPSLRVPAPGDSCFSKVRHPMLIA